MQSWSEYFELSKNQQPGILLQTAISLAPTREYALDLGAGSLKDTKFLLSMGFQQVTAIDHDPAIKNYISQIPRSLLKIKIKKFEAIQRLPKQKFDLINASYSLPFTKPPHLNKLIKQIILALQPKGIFCGQFFGPKDSWNKIENQMSFLDRSTLNNLLAPLKIIHFEESQKDAKTIDGELKHWHLFDIIAQKP